MKTIKISIPSMTSTHCQARVQLALSKIDDLQVDQINPASVTLSLADEEIQKEALAAIEQAGYAVEGITTTDDQENPILQFKTNINCGGCVAKVTPVLAAQTGIAEWSVDTTNKDKILSVKSKGIAADEIIEAIQETGFKIEAI